jgi:hypothetical protein
VTHAAEALVLGDGLVVLGLGEVGLGEPGLVLGDGLVVLGLGEVGLGEPGLGLGDGTVALGLGESELDESELGLEDGTVLLGLGELALGDSELDDGDGEAEVAFGLGDVLGECSAALWVSGSQPVSMTMAADTTSAGQIRFSFTSSSFACRRPNLGHRPAAPVKTR